MDITPEARQRLNSFMDARRLDLGLTWRELAVRAGISYESLRTLRTGPGGMRPLMMRKLDAGLRWAAGSMERVAYDNGEPAPLDVTDGAPLDAEPEPAAEATSEGVLSQDDLVEEAVRAAIDHYRAQVRARMAELAAEREADGRSA